MNEGVEQMAAQLNRLVVVLLAVTLSLVGVGMATVANADPSGNGSEPPSCTFALSTPRVVQISGVDMVTATVSSYPCAGRTVPDKTIVCVSLQGSGSPPQCVQQNAQDQPAQVYYAPYRPHATYVSSGTGCASLFQAPYVNCSSLGPTSAEL